jgi:hypothetical protein
MGETSSPDNARRLGSAPPAISSRGQARREAIEDRRDTDPEFDLKWLAYQQGSSPTRLLVQNGTAIVALISILFNVYQFYENQKESRLRVLDEQTADRQERDFRREEIGVTTMEFYLANKDRYLESARTSPRFREAVLNAIGQFFDAHHGQVLLGLFYALDSNISSSVQQAGQESAERLAAAEAVTEEPRPGRTHVFVFGDEQAAVSSPQLNALRSALLARGDFDVKNPQAMPFAPNKNEVRYYYAEDRPAAEELAKAAREILRQDVTEKSAFERASTHQRGAIALWLGR